MAKTELFQDGCNGTRRVLKWDVCNDSAKGAVVMPYELLADLAVLVHTLFVLFVIGGGVLVIRWPKLAWLHLPAACWGVAIELGGWVCPLTHLENYWRQQAGRSGYSGTFIQHYLEPLLYPLGLSPQRQVLLGLLALSINAIIYGYLWRRNRGN